jgi:hypothetical protein
MVKNVMTLDEALQSVIENCPNEYAKTYAKAMPQAIAEYGKEGQRVQCLYILSNIVDLDDDNPEKWTGELADEVIETLEKYSKE